jgi:hypothetical protein
MQANGVYRPAARVILLDERFFVARCTTFEPHRDNFEAHEHTFMVQQRWWFVTEIARSTDCLRRKEWPSYSQH